MRLLPFLPALALTALLACQREDAPNASQPERPDAEAAIACMAWIGVQRDAVTLGQAPGDAAALATASETWRTLAAQSLSMDDLDLSYATTAAQLSAAAPDRKAREAAACVKRAARL